MVMLSERVVQPGQSAQAVLTIANDGDVPSRYAVQLSPGAQLPLGFASESTVGFITEVMEPGGSTTYNVPLSLPPEISAGAKVIRARIGEVGPTGDLTSVLDEEFFAGLLRVEVVEVEVIPLPEEPAAPPEPPAVPLTLSFGDVRLGMPAAEPAAIQQGEAIIIRLPMDNIGPVQAPLRLESSITRGGFVSRTTSGGNFQQLIFENSTVAHGMTTLLGTNTFFQLGNLINSGGGADIFSASEGDRATNWFSATGAAEDTTTSTTATANFELSMGTKSGTNVQDVAASGNMFIVSNRATNALIVKGNGALHVNVSTGAGNVGVFDGEQDALACQDIAYAIGGQYKKIMHYATPRLEKLGIMTNGFIHTQALWAMQLGAIGELYGVLNYLLSKQGMDYEAIRQEIRAQA